VTVIKRQKQDSAKDFVQALDELRELLVGQGENEAGDFLKDASVALKKIATQESAAGAKNVQDWANKVRKAFTSEEFELESYILEKVDPAKWGPSEELSMAASRVLNLSKRLTV
jgi:hypothetical protein